MFWRLALVIWLLLWARTGFPWRSFQWTPSFQNVELIPFLDGSLRGYVLNALAFVPLGMIGIGLGAPSRMVIGAGFSVSFLTECLQLLSSRRYPSTTDLILNTLGALIGVCIAVGWSRFARRSVRATEIVEP